MKLSAGVKIGKKYFTALPSTSRNTPRRGRGRCWARGPPDKTSHMGWRRRFVAQSTGAMGDGLLALWCIWLNLSKTFLSDSSEHTAGFGGGVCAQNDLYIFKNPSRVSAPSCFLPVILWRWRPESSSEHPRQWRGAQLVGLPLTAPVGVLSHLEPPRARPEQAQEPSSGPCLLPGQTMSDRAVPACLIGGHRSLVLLLLGT